MVELIECGAVNNSKKQIHRGKSVTTFAYGSKRIYDYVDDNPAIEILPVDYVNNPEVICKNDKAHQSLSEQLKVHSIRRIYVAIVHGNIKEDSGTVNAPVGRHPTDRKKMSTHCKNGREAITHYKVLERFGDYTYIQCELETGRTHQIRVHMASIGHPLLGDAVYGPKKCPVKNLQGQTLHAMVLGFIHPRTGAYMEFEAPIPEYFSNLLLQFRKNV